MAPEAWLTIIGIGEDGPDGLSAAARTALAQAGLVMGPARHLSLLPAITCTMIEWPVPFADGIALLMQHRGQRVVMLASKRSGRCIPIRGPRRTVSAYTVANKFLMAVSATATATAELRPYARWEAGNCN